MRRLCVDQARAALILGLLACGEAPPREPSEDAGPPVVDAGIPLAELPFATEVVDFSPGPGAGFGQVDFPEIVLGPPKGYGPQRGSTDVLSLGHGGSITLGFAPRVIVDGPGDDFLIFENPFWVGASPDNVFAELGSIEVSSDNENWYQFDCKSEQIPPDQCAGYTPTERFDSTQPLTPDRCGGDGFDLAALGLAEARFVRITDLSHSGGAPSAGFDLDAVGLIHYRE